MAYSNWGATVLMNDKPRLDKEDVGIWDTDEANIPSSMRIFVNILKNEERNCNRPDYHSHHAVLGDGLVRLCGYKTTPSIWIMDRETGEGHKIELYDFKSFKKEGAERSHLNFEHRPSEGEIELNFGEDIWEYKVKRGDNYIILELVEPNGNQWWAKCGYGIGAGFDH